MPAGRKRRAPSRFIAIAGAETLRHDAHGPPAAATDQHEEDPDRAEDRGRRLRRDPLEGALPARAEQLGRRPERLGGDRRPAGLQRREPDRARRDRTGAVDHERDEARREDEEAEEAEQKTDHGPDISM
ncbi:MAG: hypothetical protein M1823_006590 [Watsoniomyces obsoletus]|nr:MAG: hypothetical protein M1823_006590 [Watsoniomyces obsoletus]